MRVLFIVPYPTEAPSNRLRVEQYFPYLRRHGVEPILRPFMSSDLYNIRYAPGSMIRKVASLATSTVSRFLDVERAEHSDLIFIHREAFPVGGPFIEEKLACRGPLIFDFDDAIYLLNTGVISRTVELLKRPSKTARIVNLATTVVAGNENLKAYASRYNANITVIPTPVDSDVFAPRGNGRATRRHDRVVIGWMGSNTTAPYLKMVGEALAEIARRYPNVEIRAIGGSYVPPVTPSLTIRRWNLDTELEDLHGFDIGIMPMPDTEWTRGKCGFKALLYMSCAIPPVCSPVGLTTEIVQDGENGLLATTTEEWIQKLSMLVDDPALRQRMGEAGRGTVEEKYSLTAHAPRFLETLVRTADLGPRRT